MLLIEYRIKLPLSIDQYQIAHLHTTMEMSKEYTSSGTGIEILESTPCDAACLPNQQHRKDVSKVQRTSKQYHIPNSMASPLNLQDCILRESSFNGFPNMRTVVTAESGANGEFTIDTLCMRGDDERHTNLSESNVFRLPKIMLKKRSVVHIDIADDSGLPSHLLEDPKKVDLNDEWQDALIPRMSMVVYKLVFVKSRDVNKESVNSLVMNMLRQVFTIFHRKMVCSQDSWKGLTLEDIRIMEDETKGILDRKRKK